MLNKTLTPTLAAALLVSLSACTITVPPVTTPPATAAPATTPPPTPETTTVTPGFTYRGTDPSGKQVNVAYYGGSAQRRLSVAVKPDGTVLLTSTNANIDRDMADMADALRLMAGPEPTPGISITEEDYFAPPVPDCKQCRTNIECEECYEYIEENAEQADQRSRRARHEFVPELDPVRDGK